MELMDQEEIPIYISIMVATIGDIDWKDWANFKLVLLGKDQSAGGNHILMSKANHYIILVMDLAEIFMLCT